MQVFGAGEDDTGAGEASVWFRYMQEYVQVTFCGSNIAERYDGRRVQVKQREMQKRNHGR